MQYINVREYKPLHETPRRLGELEEQRHILLSVQAEEGHCIAKFPNGKFSFPAELCEELESLVGREIAILRLGGYHIRAVDGLA